MLSIKISCVVDIKPLPYSWKEEVLEKCYFIIYKRPFFIILNLNVTNNCFLNTMDFCYRVVRFHRSHYKPIRFKMSGTVADILYKKVKLKIAILQIAI